jgi:hypothetical protein
VRQIEGQREERNERRLDRAQDNARADRAEDRQGQILALQKEQFSLLKSGAKLQPLADGRFARIDASGKVLGYAKDPATGQDLMGPKDLSAATKLLVEVNKGMIEANNKRLKDSYDPAEQQRIAEENKLLKAEIDSLIGKKGGDPASGPQPSAEDIAGLQARASDQRAVKFFEDKYGQGSAARHTQQDAPKPAAATPKPAATAKPKPADQRDYDNALEKQDSGLRRLGNLARMKGIDAHLSSKTWIDYVARLKELRAGK